MLIDTAQDAQNLNGALHTGGPTQVLGYSSNSLSLKTRANLYETNSFLEQKYTKETLDGLLYPGYCMVSPDLVLDGWEQSGSLRSHLNRFHQGFIVFTSSGAAQFRAYQDPDSVGIKLDSIKDERSVFVNASSSPAGGGGGVTPEPELEFLTGGLWSTAQYDGNVFSLEPTLRAGFLEPRRPPGDAGFRPIVSPSSSRATIYVLGLDGKIWFWTTDFMLETVSKQYREQVVLVSTQEGSSINFACEPDGDFIFSGKLVNTPDYDWARNWQYNWDRYLKGSVTARNMCRTVILYNGRIVAGYLNGFESTSTSDIHFLDSLSFSMRVSSYQVTPAIYEGSVTSKTSINTAGSFYRAPGLSLGEATGNTLTMGVSPKTRAEEEE